MTDKLFKFSVYELLKFCQYPILCCTCANYNIVLICHVYTYINVNPNELFKFYVSTHTHTRARVRTHAHIHAHTLPHTHTHIHTRIHTKDSWQIEKNKLRYLNNLNKMIEKCKMKEFIFGKVSGF